MPISYKSGNYWKNTNKYTKVGGVWREVVNDYHKVGNNWRPVWSYGYNVSSWGNCSAECGPGTQYRSATCIRSDGVSKPDTFCSKSGIHKPTLSQSCNLGECITVNDILLTSNAAGCAFAAMAIGDPTVAIGSAASLLPPEALTPGNSNIGWMGSWNLSILYKPGSKPKPPWYVAIAFHSGCDGSQNGAYLAPLKNCTVDAATYGAGSASWRWDYVAHNFDGIIHSAQAGPWLLNTPWSCWGGACNCSNINWGGALGFIRINPI